MEWLIAANSLLSAIIGGALVHIGEGIRYKRELKERRANTIASLYTDFLVNFQEALHCNELVYAGIRFDNSGQGTFEDSEKARGVREAAENKFRDSAWRLRLRVLDPKQQMRIEKMTIAFDNDCEELSELLAVADDFPVFAESLRKEVREIIDQMQTLHKKSLDC